MTTGTTLDAALPAGVLQVALSAEHALSESGTTLGALAHPAHRVPASTTMAALDSMFRRDAALRWIVLDVPGDPLLVSRSWFELSMTGRLGTAGCCCSAAACRTSSTRPRSGSPTGARCPGPPPR